MTTMQLKPTIPGYIFLFFVIVVVLMIVALQGCAVFDRFQPIITALGHELLAELDELLTEYEAAEMPSTPTPEGASAFIELQQARHATIENKLYHASLEAPNSAVRPFRKRLHAVPLLGP